MTILSFYSHGSTRIPRTPQTVSTLQRWTRSIVPSSSPLLAGCLGMMLMESLSRESRAETGITETAPSS